MYLSIHLFNQNINGGWISRRCSRPAIRTCDFVIIPIHFLTLKIFKFPNRIFWNFYNYFSSPSFFLSSFFQGLNGRYIRHLSSNHRNFFSASPCMVFIYKSRSNFNPTTRRNREHHLGEVRQKSSSYTKFRRMRKVQKS